MSSKNHVYLALSHLIKVSQCKEIIELRKLKLQNSRENSIRVLKEFNTIKICGPRQSGHTVAIIDTIINSKTIKDVLVLSYGQKSSQHISEMLYEKLKINNIYVGENRLSKIRFHKLKEKSSVVQIDVFENIDSYRGLYFDLIFVDIASFISENQKEKLYGASVGFLAKNPNFLLIFME